MFRYAAHKRVVISLKTGLTVTGIITRHRRGYCIVRDAQIIEPGGSSAPADGEILVQRDDIDYVQIPAAVR